MRKILALAMAILMVLCIASCGAGSKETTPASGSESGSNASALKIGVILVGDETEGYTLAHINGIKKAASELGLSDDQFIWKMKVEENEDCFTAAKQLVAAGCNLIVSNSYGHQDFIAEAAEAYPDVNFVAATGDYAAISGLDNLFNAFTGVYESRYVSGVVAGMKLQEMLDAGQITDANRTEDGKVKLGYVGAYPYAEVVSGYTAYYLGVTSIVSDVTMEVAYTNSWFDIEGEAAAAETLMADGCVIIAQHADSTGAPTAVQKALDNGKTAYSIGYNVSMLDVAPQAALTSASNNWDRTYVAIFSAAMKGEKIPQDLALGYKDDGVCITELGESAAAGTAEKVAEVIAAIKDGSLKVFDTSKFTVGGETLTECEVNLSYVDWAAGGTVVYEGATVNAIKTENGVSYFDESSFRSAPYFQVRIDGIVELSEK